MQGQGYIARALGVADVLAVSYFHTLRVRPEEPHAEDRDCVLLSIGHCAITLYAALIEAENHSVIDGLGEAVAALRLRSVVTPVFRRIDVPKRSQMRAPCRRCTTATASRGAGHGSPDQGPAPTLDP